MDTITLTTEARFKKALSTARKAGVKVRSNVQKCCRGCIVEADLGMAEDSTQPYAYTYGGQGGAISWVEGEPVSRDEMKRARRSYYAPRPSTVDAAYFNWGNGSGEILAEAFRAEGFEVEWDGTEIQCVVVKFPKVEGR